VDSLKTVYSKEQPLTPISDCSSSCKNNCVCPKGTVRKCTQRRQIPGSISFVPSVVGLIISSEVVKDLIKE
jgi:tRNA A37 threonylcarbamoyladenosine dehydratase